MRRLREGVPHPTLCLRGGALHGVHQHRMCELRNWSSLEPLPQTPGVLRQATQEEDEEVRPRRACVVCEVVFIVPPYMPATVEVCLKCKELVKEARDAKGDPFEPA
jgi:hypothetical protein